MDDWPIVAFPGATNRGTFEDMTADGMGILVALVLGFSGLLWRQSAWSSRVDERIDDPRADLGGRINDLGGRTIRIESRLDAFLDRRGAD